MAQGDIYIGKQIMAIFSSLPGEFLSIPILGGWAKRFAYKVAP